VPCEEVEQVLKRVAEIGISKMVATEVFEVAGIPSGED
jgi:hypothetical protein